MPVAALTENFSPMSRMAPPPLGSDTDGGAGGPPAAGCHPFADPGAPPGAPDPLPRLRAAPAPGAGTAGTGLLIGGTAGSAGNTAQPSARPERGAEIWPS